MVAHFQQVKLSSQSFQVCELESSDIVVTDCSLPCELKGFRVFFLIKMCYYQKSFDVRK